MDMVNPWTEETEFLPQRLEQDLVLHFVLLRISAAFTLFRSPGHSGAECKDNQRALRSKRNGGPSPLVQKKFGENEKTREKEKFAKRRDREPHV